MKTNSAVPHGSCRVKRGLVKRYLGTTWTIIALTSFLSSTPERSTGSSATFYTLTALLRNTN